MSYPIANYVTCTNSSIAHQNFLALTTKVKKPKYYHQVAKDSSWRAVLRKKSEHSKRIKRGSYGNCHLERNLLTISGFTKLNIT